MMSQNKIYSLGKVPFSWENEPGICKVSQKECPKDVRKETHKLPPPPCPSDCPKVVGHDLQIPLPPCPFQPPLRSASKKGLKTEDPFLAAYEECTKSERHGEFSKGRNKGGDGRRLVRRIFMISCKNSCGVRDDGLVRMDQLPLARRESFRR